MNKEIVKGHWSELKGLVKQKWGEFTDDEITQMQGTYEELSGKLQKKYGYEKDRAETEINQFVEQQKLKDLH